VSYRGRFAPSPTGALHFGSLVAALASWLDARAKSGTWLVRIDDLDQARIVPGAQDAILRALEACALDWDGTPVRSSAFAAQHETALAMLRAGGWVYPCACSRREIADSGASGIQGAVYPGTCRGGLPGGRPPRAERLRTGHPPIEFTDSVQGRVVQAVEHDIGDFVLRRADGPCAYQLAVVVDDTAQGITDVVRGADLLDSTPRQILLAHRLGVPVPRYAHVPVAVNAEGQKLSKQTHARTLHPTHPGAAVNAALAFLGHPAPSELAAAPAAELLAWARSAWTLAGVPRQRTAQAPAGWL